MIVHDMYNVVDILWLLSSLLLEKGVVSRLDCEHAELCFAIIVHVFELQAVCGPWLTMLTGGYCSLEVLTRLL